jgi:hypothetical protein
MFPSVATQKSKREDYIFFFVLFFVVFLVVFLAAFFLAITLYLPSWEKVDRNVKVSKICVNVFLHEAHRFLHVRQPAANARAHRIVIENQKRATAGRGFL